MQNEQNTDVDLNVLGTGCVASCGTGCLAAILILILALILGAQAVRNTPALIILGFFVGCVVVLATGYFIARAAQARNVAVNFHVIIYGIVLMVIDLLGFITTANKPYFSGQMLVIFQSTHILRWMLTIPLMLWGASWAKEENIR